MGENNSKPRLLYASKLNLYDTKGVKAYDGRRDNKYENRKDTENIFPEGITDAEFTKAIIDIFCGVDWYISYPGSQTRVNEEALETIIESITNKSVETGLKELERIKEKKDG